MLMSETASPIPRHLAVIMDGNGRWAEQRRRPRLIGHRAGARAVNLCLEFCLERGVEALTLFAFSSENWGRPQEEVSGLMKLFAGSLDREADELHRRGIRLRFIGDAGRFSDAHPPAHAGRGSPDGGQHADDADHCRQLRRAPGHRRCGAWAGARSRCRPA
jgi:Undecaprenyl pyrophosphate synthetase (EC 2.5.1.31)